MILAATNPETGGFTWGYALGALTLVAVLIGLGVITYLLDRRFGANIRRYVSRALDNGDSRVGDAADEMWDARSRPAIPRQLENR